MGGEHVKKPNARLALGGVLAAATLIVLSAATSEARFTRPPSWTTNPGIVLDPDVPPPPPSPTPVPPFKRPGIDIVARKARSLTIKWCDGSSADTAHGLFRGPYPDAADDNLVEKLTATTVTGCHEYVNEGLEPDTQYCFSVAPMDFFSVYADYFSGIVCAYTREEPSRPVWRVELEVRTDSRENAGTDDSVRVRLNSPPTAPIYDLPTFYPNGNMTWLDYGRDDFERGRTDFYDLNLNQISELGDIHRIDFSIDGGDEWCMSGFALWVNGVEVYNESFGPSCLASEDWGSSQTFFYAVSHDKLRAHPLWQAYETPSLVPADAQARLDAGQSVEILRIPRDELVSRIEGLIGDSIRYNDLEWGELFGQGYVETFRSGTQVVHVDLDLEADVPALSNPEVDIDVDLRFSMACRADGQGIDFQFETENFVPNVDGSLFTQFVGLLFCTIDAQCHPTLLSYIESQLWRSFKPIEKTISIQSLEAIGACALGYVPKVTVTQNADLVIEIGPKPGGPTPTPTPKPYGGVRDAFVRPVGGLIRR